MLTVLLAFYGIIGFNYKIIKWKSKKIHQKWMMNRQCQLKRKKKSIKKSKRGMKSWLLKQDRSMSWIWRREQSKELRNGRNFKTYMKKRRRYKSNKRLKLRFNKKEKLKLNCLRRKSANVSKNKKLFDNKRSKNEKKKEKSKE